MYAQIYILVGFYVIFYILNLKYVTDSSHAGWSVFLLYVGISFLPALAAVNIPASESAVVARYYNVAFVMSLIAAFVLGFVKNSKSMRAVAYAFAFASTIAATVLFTLLSLPT